MAQISSEKLSAAIWGFIRIRIAPLVREQTSRLSAEYIPEGLKGILSDLTSVAANIIESMESPRYKIFFEAGSDILEEISDAIKTVPEEKEKVRPEERRIRITWPSLEELRAIKENAQNSSLKKDFLKKFFSKNVWEDIDKLSDEEVDQFLDVLIKLSELQREIEKEYKVKIDLKTLWGSFSEGIRRLYETSKEKLSEVKNTIKTLDKKTAEQGEGIKEFRKKIRRGGLFPRKE